MDRFRTINGAYEELIKMDPGCRISKYMIRQMVKDGTIPSIRRGNRNYIDVDYLIHILEERTRY